MLDLIFGFLLLLWIYVAKEFSFDIFGKLRYVVTKLGKDCWKMNLLVKKGDN